MKDKVVASVLAFFLGGLGIHKFYLRQNLAGVIYLLLSWTFIPACISFFEAFYYFFMSETNFNEKYNKGVVAAKFVDKE